MWNNNHRGKPELKNKLEDLDRKKSTISSITKKNTIMQKAEKTNAAAPDVTQTQLSVYNCLFKGIAATNGRGGGDIRGQTNGYMVSSSQH